MSLLHPKSPARCTKPCCAPDRIAADNLVLAETTDIEVRCPVCTNRHITTLARVHREQGRSLCPRCHRRAEPPVATNIMDHHQMPEETEHAG